MSESLKMLRPKEGQLDAVFACFGSAAQHAQMFEAELKRFLVAYNKIANTHIVELRTSKKTMGALLTEMRKYVRFDDDEIDAKIEGALKGRNFLMHHFFLERDEKLGNQKGRMELLAELLRIETDLRTVRGWIGGLRVAMTKTGANGRTPSGSDDEVVFTAKIDIPE